MSHYRENHYKERTPEETIERIQTLLQSFGIEVEEECIPDSSADTCSLRLNIKGTTIGSNGKGVSPVYAKASAYAEFMERLQNDIFLPFPRYPRDESGCYSFPDEKFLTSEQVADLDNSFMEYFFRVRNMSTASIEEKREYIRKYERRDYFIHGLVDSYEVRPFYSVRKRKVEYLPYYMYTCYYNSNGMSAGNTPEEALVQAFSEIIERHVQERIYLEKPSLPDIPDWYIQKFPYIWERVEKIRKIPGIRMFMKDCSFGGNYPVAALILIDENTGKYGVKLGCHPHYAIAMERTITEAAQGNDYAVYAHRSMLDFSNNNVDTIQTIYNSFKYGMAPFPYQIFGAESSWKFQEPKDVSTYGNKEILKMLLEGFTKAGYDVLIRDVSYMGFYSYHVIVPGISEMNRDHSVLFSKMLNTKTYLTPYLNEPKRIDARIAKLLRAELDYWSDFQIENTMKVHYSVYPDFDFPAEELGLGWLYMAAMCDVFLGEYQAAASRMKALAMAAENWNSLKKDFYQAVFQYISARAQDMEHDSAMKFIAVFFDTDICKRIEEIFAEVSNVFVSQYPNFENWENPKEADCEYKKYVQLRMKLRAYMIAHPIEQKDLETVLFG